MGKRSKAPPTQAAPPARTWLPAVGSALVLIAFGASAMLVRGHFGGRLPGCGGESDCEALERSAWGSVPGTRWPVSFVGAAWFAGLLVAWLVARGRPDARMRWIARLGAAASLAFLCAMAAYGKLCPYCLVVHLSNLSFVIVLELAARGRSGASMRLARPLVAGLAVFILTSAGLAIAEEAQRGARVAVAAKEREALVKTASAKSAKPAAPVDRWGAAGFTGRYRQGPESATTRIVVFTDYQCPDCKSMESEIEKAMATHPGTSLSIKQFPMSTSCNPHASRDLHPNACWAARAAESAGILGGDEAFFAMHRWLFEMDGRFESQAELDVGIRRAGLDPSSFTAVMEGAETLKRVQADVEEGKELGLFFTPMIFVNGVELKWSLDPSASVEKTMAALEAAKLPPATAAVDRPPLAEAKYLEDWQQQARRTLPADPGAWPSKVDASAAKIIDVVEFGDYQEEHVAELEAAFDSAVLSLPKGVAVRRTFRHYPVNAECNDALPPNLSPAAVHPLSCRASRAAEAAGRVGGADAYWRMHDWLLASQATYSDEAAAKQASAMGLDAAAFRAAMDSGEVRAAIELDARAFKGLQLNGIPTLFVSGRRVPRTDLDGRSVLPEILAAAASE